jgi:uncharacterized protein (DUF1697 family)
MSQDVFILLFRGINIGGNKIVRMETLREVLAEAGFGSVATYIQSGNVVLTSEKDESAIAATVEAAFPKAFGFTSHPTVRSLDTWRRMIADNPFAAAAQDGKRVHAVLLDGTPSEEAVQALRALATTERMELREGVLYLHTPDGFGRSKVAGALDKVLQVPLTARNWNTVLKLQEMAENRGEDESTEGQRPRR